LTLTLLPLACDSLELQDIRRTHRKSRNEAPTRKVGRQLDPRLVPGDWKLVPEKNLSINDLGPEKPQYMTKA
jgi:hypothetical protein